jgi:isochorismate synthase
VAAMRSRLPQLLAGAAPAANDRLLSITLGLPGLKLRGVPELTEGTVYWSRPEVGQTSCGRGSACELLSTGSARFAELRRHLERLPSRWLRIHTGHHPGTTRLMLAFSFGAEREDPAFANARLHLPEIMFEQRAGHASLTFSAALPIAGARDQLGRRWLAEGESLLRELTRPTPPLGQVRRVRQVASLPSREEWLGRVEEARRLIRSGEFSKVVLSRRLRVRLERTIDAPRVVNWLQGHYPSCTHVAYAHPQGTLISASPERLVSLRDGHLRSDALASTTVRSPDPAEDKYLEQELLANPKAREEHGFVVAAIVEALQPLCRRVGTAPEPRLMKLETLQHLWTPIEGEVKPGTTLLECAERLHPTPAVGGYPRGPALRWLATQGEHRGWFTGGIGWVTPQGDGELAVVLRCAMVEGDAAEVFAGAGIVSDSDPEAELGETELKMRVMLEALASAAAGS